MNAMNELQIALTIALVGVVVAEFIRAAAFTKDYRWARDVSITAAILAAVVLAALELAK